ncbi:MAG: hypothetical protein IPM89_14520 [Candidatus Competibacteraceae bacterium]|nr:MAG: hypothetical protein IPM89_14520 [Candidatus Competibacteraceae bacterium]
MNIEIDFGYLPTEHHAEPAMFLRRGAALVAVGLSVAHRFLDDAEAVRRGTQYAVQLYGAHGFTRGEVLALIRKVTNEFRTLLAMPPAPVPDLMKQAERDHLVVRANGEIVFDAR